METAKILRQSIDRIVAGLGDLTLDEVKALHAAEQAKGGEARGSLLDKLNAEIAARGSEGRAVVDVPVPDLLEPDAAIAMLAFRDKGGATCFTIPVDPGDIERSGVKAIYRKEVVLRPDKPRATVSEVIALDDTGRPLARVSWPVPLQGGGGLRAMFPARHIAFDLAPPPKAEEPAADGAAGS